MTWYVKQQNKQTNYLVLYYIPDYSFPCHFLSLMRINFSGKCSHNFFCSYLMGTIISPRWSRCQTSKTVYLFFPGNTVERLVHWLSTLIDTSLVSHWAGPKEHSLCMFLRFLTGDQTCGTRGLISCIFINPPENLEGEGYTKKWLEIACLVHEISRIF